MRIGASKSVGHGVRVYASENVGGKKKKGSGCLTSIIAVLGVLVILGAFLGSGDKDGDNKTESEQEVRSAVEETQTEKAEDPEVLQIIEEPSEQEKSEQNSEAEKQITGQASNPIVQPAKQGTFVGSRESDKYHKPSCRFAKEILPENLIEWSSIEDAQAYGYKPCGVCHP